MSLVPPGLVPSGLIPPGTKRLDLPQAALFLGAGAGPPVLCIPGGYHGAWCFSPWLAGFAAAGIAAGAVELRGKGTLEAQPPAAGIEDYVADVLAAAALLPEPPVLLGHSLGALIAMKAAERLPGCAGLLLVAPSPPGNLPGAAPVRLVPEGERVAPPAEAVVVERYLGGMRPPGLAAYVAALSPESPRVLNDRYALRIAVDPARLAGMPVLVLEAGRDDQERHPAGQDAAIARFLGGEYRLLPDLPHCCMLPPWAEAGLAPIIAWHRQHRVAPPPLDKPGP